MTRRAFGELVTSLRAGRYPLVEQQAREWLASEPASGVVWQILGAALAAQGKDPVPALSAAVRLLPNDAGAHNNLANAFARLGKLDDAVAGFKRALLLNPNFAEGHNNLAHALLEQGDFTDALQCSRRAIELKPGFAEAHDNHGSALLALQRLDEAEVSYRHATAIEPAFAEAHNNLGNTLQRRGQIEAAATCYRRALALRPDFSEAHNNLGNTFRSAGQLRDALLSYDRALQVNPRFAEAYCNRAIALRLQGHAEEAQASCRAALAIGPRSSTALMVLAELGADRGEFDNAEDLFRHAIRLEPQSPEAWAGLVRLRRMTTADTSWLKHAQRILASGLPPLKEITLRYAIGKYFDDVGEFDQAFAHFWRANELTKSCRPPHDRLKLTRTVDFITRTYDEKWMSESRLSEFDSPRPIFIVGMLRSGTTLADQILASHPTVCGVGELAFWSGAFEKQRLSGADLQDRTARIGGRVCAPHERVIKRQRLGVGQDAHQFRFPRIDSCGIAERAHHSHATQSWDTCLSIYSQHFESTASYANDLEDLAHYYSEYLRVMAHWRDTLPQNTMLEVPYEALVADQEGWSRAMLKFVGLPWDPLCLEFHRTDRSVITASRWQVRQKINSASIGRWRNYREYLGPLRQLLDARPANN